MRGSCCTTPLHLYQVWVLHHSTSSFPIFDSIQPRAQPAELWISAAREQMWLLSSHPSVIPYSSPPPSPSVTYGFRVFSFPFLFFYLYKSSGVNSENCLANNYDQGTSIPSITLEKRLREFSLHRGVKFLPTLTSRLTCGTLITRLMRWDFLRCSFLLARLLEGDEVVWLWRLEARNGQGVWIGWLICFSANASAQRSCTASDVGGIVVMAFMMGGLSCSLGLKSGS
jgi:hypothetical protein